MAWGFQLICVKIWFLGWNISLEVCFKLSETLMEKNLQLLDLHIDLNNDKKEHVMFCSFIINANKQEFFAQWWWHDTPIRMGLTFTLETWKYQQGCDAITYPTGLPNIDQAMFLRSLTFIISTKIGDIIKSLVLQQRASLQMLCVSW